MNDLHKIARTKALRQDADLVLQEIKVFRDELKAMPDENGFDKSEAIAQCIISSRDLESSIMRLGMVLKALGNPTPYPQSYNPQSPVVEPTADNLKL